MSFLSKLFGLKPKPEAEPVLHKDCRIFVAPQSEQGGFRIAARIEKDMDGKVRTHQMIRADKCQSMEDAAETTLFKAKMLIDQQGDSIFR